MMKIYLAGTSIKEMAQVSQSVHQMEAHLGRERSDDRLLLSYYYVRQMNLTQELETWFPGQPPDLFLDSGAFSAMTQGAQINLGRYAQYIGEHQGIIAAYANLDVIRRHRATLHNQRELEQRYSLSPLPVFHVCEPWEVLESYMERYSYIALGVAGSRWTMYMPWLVKCFRMAEGRNVVFHGFGITAWEAMVSFPWYSVDSSSWSVGRFGRVWIFDEQKGNLREGFCEKDKLLARRFGMTPDELRAKDGAGRTLANVLSVLAFHQAETWLTKRWGPIPIPEGSHVA